MALLNSELSDDEDFLNSILNDIKAIAFYPETEDGEDEFECAVAKAMAQYNEELMLDDQCPIDETGAYDFRRGFRYGIGWVFEMLKKTNEAK